MASSSSSKGSLIPFEILESILGWVPAEALKRFKLTCKRWHALFKDKRFIYNHLDLIQEHFIRLTADMVEIINLASNAHDSSLPLPNKLSNMIHCDGLLLCIFHESTRLAVWNPCFNQVKWIIKSMGSYSFHDSYGIGYDDGVSRDNYKILRFYDEHIFEDNPTALSAFREDKLSLLHQRVNDEEEYQVGEIGVWVTNSVKDRVVSWTKLFVVWRPDLPELHFGDYDPHPLYFIAHNNRINVIIYSEELLTDGSKSICVNLYIIGKDGWQKKEIERHRVEESWSTYKCGYTYLPSLVPVP